MRPVGNASLRALPDGKVEDPWVACEHVYDV
jgi:hypothetical protein